MKLVIYGLVLVNMTMLGWLYRHRDEYRDPPLPVMQQPAFGEPLVLLRERGSME